MRRRCRRTSPPRTRPSGVRTRVARPALRLPAVRRIGTALVDLGPRDDVQAQAGRGVSRSCALVEVTEISTDPCAVGPTGRTTTRLHRHGRRQVLRRQQRADAEQARAVQPWLRAPVRRLRVQHRLPRGARPRLHALRPGRDRARHQEVRRRVRVCTATPRPTCCTARRGSKRWACRPTTSRWRSGVRHAGRRCGASRKLSRKPYGEVLAHVAGPHAGRDADGEEAAPFAAGAGRWVHGRVHAGEPVPEAGIRASAEVSAHPVSLHRLSRSGDAWQIASRVPGFVLGIAALAAERRADAASPEHRALARRRSREAPTIRTSGRDPPGDALLRLRPVSRRVLLREQGRARASPGTRACGWRTLERVWEEKKFPDGSTFFDYKHGETGAEIIQGPAPRVRALEPGHSRPQRRELRRLPHALRA